MKILSLDVLPIILGYCREEQGICLQPLHLLLIYEDTERDLFEYPQQMRRYQQAQFTFPAVLSLYRVG